MEANHPQLPRSIVKGLDLVRVLPRKTVFVVLALMNQAQIFQSPFQFFPLEFDYVIVGGGPSGCVLANRLSEDPRTRVLLLEAGGEGNIVTRFPLGTFYLWDSVFDWKYRSVPQKYTAQYLKGRVIKLPAGKILGGGTMLNTLLWVRGTRSDYQKWTDIGIEGWSYEENLPYYIKTENVEIAGLQKSKTRGFKGKVSINYSTYQSKTAQGIINAAGTFGYQTDYDYNDGKRLGFSRAQSDLLLGMREDSARAYIDPIREKRKNLFVLTHALATRILFDGKTATGVVFERNGEKYTAYATKEIIVSAGGIGSPKLLLLSGVGPRDHLRKLGIRQIHELPVGKGLQDHIGTISPNWSLKGDKVTKILEGFTPNNVSLQSSAGGFANLIDWTGFVNTVKGPDDPDDRPDIQFMGIELGEQSSGAWGMRDFNLRDDVWEKTYGGIVKTTPSALVLVLLLNYTTRGEVRLRSSDPHDPPIVDIQYLSHPEERATLLRGVMMIRDIFASKAMAEFKPKFQNIKALNCSYDNDPDIPGYLECLALGIPTTIFHYSSTMRMGADDDEEAVVDNHFRMRGLNNIRVVDTSVLPFLGSGNPQATNYMVAEKAADIIKGKLDLRSDSDPVRKRAVRIRYETDK